MIAALIERFGGFDEERKRAPHALRLAPPIELERRGNRAFASRGPAGVKPAAVAEGRMHVASTTRRLLHWRGGAPAADRAGKPRLHLGRGPVARQWPLLRPTRRRPRRRCMRTITIRRRPCCSRPRGTGRLKGVHRLDRGAMIDAKDREGKTALAKAAEADKLPLIRLLLERKANVNARSVDGSTPLFYAAEQDRGGVIALLLERGADPNLPGRKGVRSARRRSLQRFDGERRWSS